MEEYNDNKEVLKDVLNSFEPEDIATLSDILKDINKFFNEFDNLTVKDLINTVDLVIEENKNSKLSKIKEELNEKFLNKYIKYNDSLEDKTILKKVVNILVDPAFGGADFAIKFVSNQAIYNSELSLELKLFFDENEDYKSDPVVLYSELDTVEIIKEEDYYNLLRKNSIEIIKDCE